MTPKERAGREAANLVQSGMRLGLGTGSTVDCFLHALAEAIRAGRVRDVAGTPTSIRTEHLARQLGIAILPADDSLPLDLHVDGADEVDGELNLIKGLGGALLREKVVAQNARQLVIVADESKLVPRLGSKGPLPVEVVPFAVAYCRRFLADLGLKPVLRLSGREPVVTDNGNHVLDLDISGVTDLRALDRRLKSRAGIVESGLFFAMASKVIVGRETRVDVLTQAPQPL